MSAWFLDSELSTCFIPKGMTLYWYNPFGVTKAETCFAYSVYGTSQYHFSK